MFPFPVEVPSITREKPMRRMMAVAVVMAEVLCEDEKGEFHLFPFKAIRRVPRPVDADRKALLLDLVLAAEQRALTGEALAAYVNERLWSSSTLRR